MAEQNQRLHVIVEGIVQGVGFRFFVFNHGRQLNLQGWVRNKTNGKVEVIAEGPRSNLETLLELIQRGPANARVINAQVSWLESKSDLPAFTVLLDD